MITTTITTKRPDECSKTELERFIALVKKGGEVDEGGLDRRILKAAFLIQLISDTGLIGTAVIKRPNPQYRIYVSQGSGVAVSDDAFPYELGYIHVACAVRGKGYSKRLVERALTLVDTASIFATSRIDNNKMHRVLERYAFTRMGQTYQSRRGDHKLALFIRAVPLSLLCI